MRLGGRKVDTEPEEDALIGEIWGDDTLANSKDRKVEVLQRRIAGKDQKVGVLTMQFYACLV